MNRIKFLSLIFILLSTAAYAQPHAFLSQPTGVNVSLNDSLATQLKLITDTTDVLENTDFQVRLNISNVTDLHSYQLSLSFDPSLLYVDSVKEGSFLNNFGKKETTWSAPLIDNGNGTVKNINCVRTDTAGISGEGTLVSIYFRSLMPGITDIIIVQNETILNDSMNNEITIAEFSDLSINIYREPVIEIALPDTFAAPNRMIDLPITISGIENFDIISALIKVSFDSSCLKGIDIVSEGTLTESWQTPVLNNSGTSFYFALAGSAPLVGDGILVYLRFMTNSTAKEGDICILTFTEVMLNEGSPTTIKYDGQFRIRGLQIAGAVKYQGTGIPVPQTGLQLAGQQSLNLSTGENGLYNFNGLHYGNFTLTPSKVDEPGRAITPFDAALLLQHVVGNSQLNPFQLIAADVSGDSSISAYDASLIMRYSVNLENSFPIMNDSLNFWDFIPASFSINDTNWFNHPDSLVYIPLETDQFNQDFIGIIYGDVSQNWISPASESIESQQKNMIATLQLGNSQIVQKEVIEVPIYLEHANSIRSVEIELEFNDKAFDVTRLINTEISREFLIHYNSKNGILKIAMAGAKPIAQSGVLVKVIFRALKVDEINLEHQFSLARAWLNDMPVQINALTNVTHNSSIPAKLDLSPNFPNPFNQETVFRISIPGIQDNKVSLIIYNLRGQVVRTLLNGNYASGNYVIHWDGLDDKFHAVTSGEYFCILKAGDKRIIRKVVLLK